jgi:hypothetical protein
MSRMIWQYWEDVGPKPRFIDGLHAIARANCGVEITLVTPQTLSRYLPDLPKDVLRIAQVEHRADMIRTMLVLRHGGMWLDSDAVVLRDLNFMFVFLQDHEFVGFNDGGRLAPGRPWVRVNCFAARPKAAVLSQWVERQHAKFPRVAFAWEEIGSELLHPICLAHRASLRILPFETICPIAWSAVGEFATTDWARAAAIVEQCPIVMLSNHALRESLPDLRRMSVEDIAGRDWVLSGILRAAGAAGRP